MRGFEYTGRGSEKFWEVEQQGATVTVRFGRIGTAGQTRTKDMGTAGAAAAHVDKLVAEKLGKGYVERAAPAAAPPRADPPLPDEATFVLPEVWARRAEPFRGLRPAPPLAIDVAATRETADALRQRAAPLVQEALGHPSSDPGMVRGACRHRGTGVPRHADPLGAAALLAVYGREAYQNSADLPETYRLAALLLDDLVLTHGIPFAAEAGAHLIDIDVHYSHDDRRWRLCRRHVLGEMRYNWLVVEPALVRLRAHLAAAPDDAYAEAVGRLAALRDGPPIVRMATSYLVPTEQAWVRDDIATLSSAQRPSFLADMLLASAVTPADVDAALAVPDLWLRPDSPALCAVLATLGPEALGALTALLEKGYGADVTKQLLAMIGSLPTDEAFDALLDRVDRKYVQPVVTDAMRRFPVRAARLLAARAGGSSATARTCRGLLRGHVVSHPWLLERAELDASTTAAVEAITRSTSRVPAADPADVPGILVEPPWETSERAARPPVVAGLTPPGGVTLRWLPGEQDEWAHLPMFGHEVAPADWAATVAETVRGAGHYRYSDLELLAVAPADLVRPHLARYTPRYAALPPVQRILARCDDEGVDFVLRIVSAQPRRLGPALLPIESAEVATRMAEWFRGKPLRPLARAWFDRHPDAAVHLVPAALGKPGAPRTAAEAALRYLDRGGHRETVRAAAARYGAEAAAGVDAILDTDPLDRLPARIPPRPAWLDPAVLPPVLLRGRTAALPTVAVGHLCTMLALSTPGDIYAGVDVVKAATDPSSLAELAWDVFERWKGAGFPSKDGWVLTALGLLGDDETVRRLAPLIRAWPGEGGHARAAAALDVLAAIGSDVALMHLNGIAEKVKFKGLREKAREKITDVAEGLGLSADQLADRLVPDFGLDRNGSMVLDYGPRRFTVGFDEQLKPVVADEAGSRRTTLPKPAAKDDPVLAPAAYAAFSGLKKDVRTIAADQVRRFEHAMLRGRRWSAAEQRALFVEHPLLWHLTRRLVWATFDEAGAVTGSFRVAEDRTLADADDTEVTLPGDTVVGIAHPLQLGERLAAWSELFADYEILQPFPQLGRDTWALTAEERQATALHRLDDVVIPTGRVLGLAHRGWERGGVEDGGVWHQLRKPAPRDRTLVIDLEPGIIAGMATEWNEQKVTGVWISSGSAARGHVVGRFSELDDVTASELLRDLEHLRG